MYYLNKSESAERREERDRQLTELYCEIYDHLRSSRVNDLRQAALTITLATGTPRYHVGYDRAYITSPRQQLSVIQEPHSSRHVARNHIPRATSGDKRKHVDSTSSNNCA